MRQIGHMVNIGVPELDLLGGAMARTVTLHIISMRSQISRPSHQTLHAYSCKFFWKQGQNIYIPYSFGYSQERHKELSKRIVSKMHTDVDLENTNN